MKCLITGGAGFIGSHLQDKLIKEGHKVIILDNLSTGKKDNLNPMAKFYKADISDSKIGIIFKKEKPEIIFHYAAQIDVRKSVEDPLEDAKINILGAVNILENCRREKVKKVIFASTGGAMYGETNLIPTPESYSAKPNSPYGIAKLTIEKYLDCYFRNFKLPFISLRFANVYGPRQNSKGEAGVIAIFIDKMLADNQPLINGDGKQTRDFIFVEDVIHANILALKNKKTGVFNIGTAKQTDINSIFKKINNLMDRKFEEKHVPVKTGEQKTSCLSYSKAKKEMGFKPEHSLNEGLKETFFWFKENFNKFDFQ